MSGQRPSPEDQMMQWITSKWITKPISVVSELGIADLLRKGPASVNTLAEKTDTHAGTLYRILRALSSVGIFVETGEKVFGLTPLAQCLLSDAMRPMARMFLSAPSLQQAPHGVPHGGSKSAQDPSSKKRRP